MNTDEHGFMKGDLTVMERRKEIKKRNKQFCLSLFASFIPVKISALICVHLWFHF